MSIYNYHEISNNFIVGGIHKAILIDVDGELRVFIPEIHSSWVSVLYSEGSKFNINEEEILKKFKTFPLAMWNVPNLQAQQHEIPVHPCWVTFENNDIQRPVIMGWCGEGIMYHAGDSNGYYDSNGNYMSVGSGGVYSGNGTTGNSDADKIFKLLISQCGLKIPAACGVLANIWWESGGTFDPTRVEDDPSPSQQSIGLFMFNEKGHGYTFNGIKFKNLKDHCGSYGYNTIEGQIEYLRQWLNGEFTNYGNGIKCKDDLNKVSNSEDGAADAAKIFCIQFENPGIPHTEEREKKAKEYYNIFKDGKIENGQYSYSVNQSILNYFNYLESAEGNRSKEHGPGSGTQCVELPNDYLEVVFGYKNNGGFGNGNTYYNGVPDSLFEKITVNVLTVSISNNKRNEANVVLKSGDIVSMSSPYSPQYGHVVIVKSVSGNIISIYDQGSSSTKVNLNNWILNGSVLTDYQGNERIIYGIARPK